MEFMIDSAVFIVAFVAVYMAYSAFSVYTFIKLNKKLKAAEEKVEELLLKNMELEICLSEPKKTKKKKAAK